MIEFIKQCKGTDADKLKILDTEVFFTSIKYDGVYIQIQKEGLEVAFFTSSGKRFDCIYADEFRKLDFDFRIEAEYICDGGKLGTRFKADNEIKKAVKNSEFQLTGDFIVFDSLDFTLLFSERLETLYRFSKAGFHIPAYSKLTFKEAKQELETLSAQGWEGLFLKKLDNKISVGKKVKDAIKLKKKFTADLEVIETNGIYATLQDENGLIVKNLTVGADFVKVGDILEIEYEQIAKTYVVPVFKSIRYDKMDQ